MLAQAMVATIRKIFRDYFVGTMSNLDKRLQDLLPHDLNAIKFRPVWDSLLIGL
jgi:hypothetical protein